MNYEHIEALNGINKAELPKVIKGKIIRFEQLRKKVENDNPDAVDQKKLRELEAYSAVIANDIQDWIERDYPETKDQKPEPPAEPEIKEPEPIIDTEPKQQVIIDKKPEPVAKKSTLNTIFGLK